MLIIQLSGCYDPKRTLRTRPYKVGHNTLTSATTDQPIRDSYDRDRSTTFASADLQFQTLMNLFRKATEVVNRDA